MFRVLLAVPSELRWPLDTALREVGINIEAIDDLARGLRATTSSFDAAVLDGGTKSLTLKWAVGELQKRNAAVRIFTTPLAQPPEVFAQQLVGAAPKRRDFEETGKRTEYQPLFFVEATRNGAPRWIAGIEDGELIDTFLALASSLAAVQPSSALTALVDFGRDEACAWAAYEPLPPGTELMELNRLLRHERTHLSVATVAYLGARICEGLTALHAAHVRHGMVRPFAVWCPVDGPPLLRLAGMGELLEGDRLISRRSMIGTARRHDDLSPEQHLSHQRGDLRTDLYQFGHLLYEALTGYAPFQSRPHDREITPPHEHEHAVPGALSDLVVSLLALDPADRPPLADACAVLASSASTQEEALAELQAVRERLRALLA
jgi:serine/threonine protein kinase